MEMNMNIIGRLYKTRPGQSLVQAARKTRSLFETDPDLAGLAPTEIRVNPVYQTEMPAMVDDLPVIFTATVRRKRILVCCPDAETDDTEPDRP